MKLELIFALLGGLALFLYGMHMMSANLEAVAGDRLKGILEKLTANRILGVLVGAGITAIIQSSSATTVMVVGFVNSGLMTLRQAVWIIMGANIGTTITGQLVALDIGTIAPFFAFAGVAAVLFSKKKKVQNIGSIIAGLGVLFIGLGMMSDSMVPLRDSEAFVGLLTKFSNPLLGILAGAVFTAVIQSSSASVGILQALAMSGVIGLGNAVYVLFGQNIGTCITALLASVGMNRNAKRTTIIHILFNVIGTIIFVTICMTTSFTDFIASFTPDNVAAQIANVHTVFNIGTTLVLLPFGGYLAVMAQKLLPNRQEPEDLDEERWLRELSNTQHVLGSSAIAFRSLMDDTRSMMELTKQNVLASLDMLLKRDAKGFAEVNEREEQIDLYNVKISKRISKVLTLDLSLAETRKMNTIFKMTGNIERVGDHATNFAEYAVLTKEKGMKFSEETMKEIAAIKEQFEAFFSTFSLEDETDTEKLLHETVTFERAVDAKTKEYRNHQIDRINRHHCDAQSAIIYSELLTDYERIGDHMRNIAEAYAEKE